MDYGWEGRRIRRLQVLRFLVTLDYPFCCLVLPLPPPNGQRTNLCDRAHWNASKAGNERTSINIRRSPSLILSLAPSPASPWISSWLGRATRPQRRCSALQAFQVALDSEQAVDGNQCHALPKPSVEVPVAPIKEAAQRKQRRILRVITQAGNPFRAPKEQPAHSSKLISRNSTLDRLIRADWQRTSYCRRCAMICMQSQSRRRLAPRQPLLL